MVSESSLPAPSVTRVCHTWVRRPLCRMSASARITPERPAAKKLVFASSVAVLTPLAAVPAAPAVSASAISVPPCTAPPSVVRCSPASSSATTRSGPASTKRMPRCFISPTFQASANLLPFSVVRIVIESLQKNHNESLPVQACYAFPGYRVGLHQLRAGAAPAGAWRAARLRLRALRGVPHRAQDRLGFARHRCADARRADPVCSGEHLPDPQHEHVRRLYGKHGVG